MELKRKTFRASPGLSPLGDSPGVANMGSPPFKGHDFLYTELTVTWSGCPRMLSGLIFGENKATGKQTEPGVVAPVGLLPLKKFIHLMF